MPRSARLAALIAALCLCAGGLLAAVQSVGAVNLQEAPGPRPWVEVSPCLSADGRVLAFEAARHTRAEPVPRAFGPAPGDGTRAVTDIIVADLERGVSEVISTAATGGASNGSSANPRLDAHGRNAVFESEATDLVPGDDNGMRDVFVVDRSTSNRARLLPPGRKPGHASSGLPAIAADGGRIAFITHGLGAQEDRLRIRGIVICDGPGRESRALPSERAPTYGRADVSADGRLLAFASMARDGGRGDENAAPDVFLQRDDGRPLRLSQGLGGGAGNGASLEPVLGGDACAFTSLASDLVAGDTNGCFDVFVRDTRRQRTERISVASDTGQADEASFEPSISVDGRWVAFASYASNLVPRDDNGELDVFLHDRRTGRTVLVSRAPGGRSGDGPSYRPSLSADGSRLAFASRASNLLGAASPRGGIYVWERDTDVLRSVLLP